MQLTKYNHLVRSPVLRAARWTSSNSSSCGALGESSHLACTSSKKLWCHFCNLEDHSQTQMTPFFEKLIPVCCTGLQWFTFLGVHGSDRNYLVSKLVYANYLGDVSNLYLCGGLYSRYWVPWTSQQQVASIIGKSTIVGPLLHSINGLSMGVIDLQTGRAFQAKDKQTHFHYGTQGVGDGYSCYN